MKHRFLNIVFIFLIILTLGGCKGGFNPQQNPNDYNPGDVSDLGGDDTTYGDPIEDSGVYDGEFQDEIINVTIECVEGTPNCYEINENVITFLSITEDSVYSISGQLDGNIIIDVGDEYNFDLELNGFSIKSSSSNPIIVLSGNEVAIQAKKDTKNYIYDYREAVGETDETLYKGVIYSFVDLEISGKGSLTIISLNNNGIHSKDDLQVKNLELFVSCSDNALKGNDSVEISAATLTLISTNGDGIKTTNSDISSKNNQRGIITVENAIIDIYAACDGIDAAYNVIINGDETKINIYTDKYSNYSGEVTDNATDVYYIRFYSANYKYSVQYYNSEDDYLWVDATYHSSVSMGMGKYYYYTFPKYTNYSQMRFFIYSSDMELSQDEKYAAATDYLTPNDAYDTFYFTSKGNSLTCGWTNYLTTSNPNGHPGFDGGMNEGNTDKSDYSTKGIKAANQIEINAGTINIKSYDDAIHANNDSTLENGQTPSGNVFINGGVISIYTNDDGLHADGTLTINLGTINIANSYEGIEGTKVIINGGYVSIISKDDGINGTTTTEEAIIINGGENYIYCSGDGIDSNSTTSYSGIIFNGGYTVVISTSRGNSAIDTEKGYTYTGGYVVAIMPQGGMSNEATNCKNYSSIATAKSISLSSNSILCVALNNTDIVTIQIPTNISGLVIFLGSNKATVSTVSQTTTQLDNNGVYWN